MGLSIDKKDLIIIVLLCVVFLSIALPNLGDTQTFATSAKLVMGEGFYVDLGSQVNVNSLVLVIADGAFNVSVSTGSPGDWSNSKNFIGPDYIEIPTYAEIAVNQTTRYLQVQFGYTGNMAVTLFEVAVVDQNSQVVKINFINNAGAGNPPFQNLVDEQNLVHYPPNYNSMTYFDEVLFVPASNDYLHSQTPIERTHPPLGKLIQATGIAVFGFNPWGWRIMEVIFGTLIVAVIYLLGKELLGTRIGGFAAAFLLSFDFIHFTMSRLGTVDSFVVFFSLISQLFFFIYLKNVLKNGWGTSALPLVLCIIFFGLGFSTKWLVLFGFLGEICILLALRLIDVRKVQGTISAKIRSFSAYPFFTVIVSFLAVCMIYFVTYIPDMIAGNSFTDILNLQQSMYQYHQSVTSTINPFTSPWFSWPLMFNPLNSGVHVPLWLNYAEPSSGVFGSSESSVVLMGNPAVWWVGFAAMVLLMVVTFRKVIKSKFSFRENLLPISLIIIFLFQWLAYIFIARVVYIYHFYSCVPFLCLAVAFFISKYWKSKWMKILTLAYFAAVVAMFILFYPAISGAETSPSTLSGLQWINGWWFT